jgi:hypothetical protein
VASHVNSQQAMPTDFGGAHDKEQVSFLNFSTKPSRLSANRKRPTVTDVQVESENVIVVHNLCATLEDARTKCETSIQYLHIDPLQHRAQLDVEDDHIRQLDHL